MGAVRRGSQGTGHRPVRLVAGGYPLVRPRAGCTAPAAPASGRQLTARLTRFALHAPQRPHGPREPHGGYDPGMPLTSHNRNGRNGRYGAGSPTDQEVGGSNPSGRANGNALTSSDAGQGVDLYLWDCEPSPENPPLTRVGNHIRQGRNPALPIRSASAGGRGAGRTPRGEPEPPPGGPPSVCARLSGVSDVGHSCYLCWRWATMIRPGCRMDFGQRRRSIERKGNVVGACRRI